MVAKFRPLPLPWTTSAESSQTRPTPDRRLDPEEPVLGLALGGSSRAWPLSRFRAPVVARHVTVGGRRVTLLWDGRTRTAATYAPETEDAPKQRITLVADETRRDAPWYDSETGSRWSIAGRAVSGPLRGKTLMWLPGVMVKWYAWSASYPQTTVDGSRETENPKVPN
jgi:hypothetical protein